MKLHLIPAVLAFLSAYFPLALILLVKDFDFGSRQLNHPWALTVLVLLSLLSCLVVLSAVRGIKGGVFVLISKATNKSNDMFAYTIPYMISFFNFRLDDLNMIVSLAIFMLLMFILSYRTQSMFVNPVLAIAGYSLYECQFKDGNQEVQGMVLSKEDLNIGKRYRVEKLSAYLYVETAVDEKSEGEAK